MYNLETDEALVLQILVHEYQITLQLSPFFMVTVFPVFNHYLEFVRERTKRCDFTNNQNHN